ncbi:MAG TPA: hypothetical protein VLT61_10385, partial [Anaeromyxobacteraceae bacterium]|nr:hypothetical protein [Anaeromyxobacteraceae bacterium]
SHPAPPAATTAHPSPTIDPMTHRPETALRSLLLLSAAIAAGCYVPYRYGPNPDPVPRSRASASGPLFSPRPAAPPRAASPAAGPMAGLTAGPAACQYALSQGNPLITEWPASEKANLEALLRGGAVAVEFTGCAMKLLPQCRPGGRYAFQRTTLASDSVDIKSNDELLAKLPLGAVSLEGELSRSGRLTVKTWVAGQARLEGLTPEQVPNTPECSRATHVLGGLSVGAFSLLSGGELKGGVSAAVAKLGEAGGKSTRSSEVVRSAGDPDSCTRGDEYEPHFNCRSPVQAFLWRIPGRGHGSEGPAGTIKVDLVSASASARWDVYYDDEVVCTTPCSKWLDPAHPLLFRTRDEGRYGRGADRVRVPDLMPFASTGMVQVQAHPTSDGKMATGIVFTSFGGMAAITGVALAGVGCSDTAERAGMCKAGVITGVVGGLVTAGSILMILDALPHAEFRLPGGTVGNVTVGPGFASGRF